MTRLPHGALPLRYEQRILGLDGSESESDSNLRRARTLALHSTSSDSTKVYPSSILSASAEFGRESVKVEADCAEPGRESRPPPTVAAVARASALAFLLRNFHSRIRCSIRQAERGHEKRANARMDACTRGSTLARKDARVQAWKRAGMHASEAMQQAWKHAGMHATRGMQRAARDGLRGGLVTAMYSHSTPTVLTQYRLR